MSYVRMGVSALHSLVIQNAEPFAQALTAGRPTNTEPYKQTLEYVLPARYLVRPHMSRTSMQRPFEKRQHKTTQMQQAGERLVYSTDA